MIEQEFICCICKHEETFVYQSEGLPVCCSTPMRGGDLRFPAENSTRLHLIKLHVDPIVEWSLPSVPANGVFELWKLAPGRAKGERIGYLGARETAVEWRMTPGVSFKDTLGNARHGGFANTVEEAAGYMLEAIQGGVFAAQNIEAQVVS